MELMAAEVMPRVNAAISAAARPQPALKKGPTTALYSPAFSSTSSNLSFWLPLVMG